MKKFRSKQGMELRLTDGALSVVEAIANDKRFGAESRFGPPVLWPTRDASDTPILAVAYVRPVDLDSMDVIAFGSVSFYIYSSPAIEELLRNHAIDADGSRLVLRPIRGMAD